MSDIATYVGYAVIIISSIGFIGLLVFWTIEKIINAYAGFDLIREFLQWKRDIKKDEL